MPTLDTDSDSAETSQTLPVPALNPKTEPPGPKFTPISGPNELTTRKPGERPGWMHDGAQVALLDGDEDLEVVGESFHQPNLWQLARARPGRQRVREDIYAVLVAEKDNPYDPNAVAVWINGLKVGHLSRENAQRYRPGCSHNRKSRGCRSPWRASSQEAVSATMGRGYSACS